MSTTPEPAKEDALLVNVKAQVMTQKDEIGGWIPMGPGGLSQVALRRRSINSCPNGVEYLIQGKRMSDKSEVLHCVLRTDLSYKNPNPTFHYWKSDERPFGLTFQTPGDATAFHRGVKRAMADMKCGSGDKKNTGNGDVNGDEDVFMELELPLGRKDSNTNSASTNSTTTSSPGLHSPALGHDSHTHLHKIEYGPKQIQRKPSPSSLKSNKSGSSGDSRDYRDDRIWVPNDKRPSIPRCGHLDDSDLHKSDPYYVQLAKPNTNENTNDYSYPALQPYKAAHDRCSFKKTQTYIDADLNPFQTALPTKSKRTDKGDTNRNTTRQSKHLISKRSRCCHCNEMYAHSENQKGSCQYAPDQFEKCIERVSCICCARGMLYHCLSDADGDFTHPCVCKPQDENNSKKWTALAVLSLFVPCLWCYWPLIACHHCGVSCGCCGGRHETASSSSAHLTPDMSNC